MAINAFEKIEAKYSSNNSREALPSKKSHHLSIFTEDSISSSDRSNKIKKKKTYNKSPYLNSDNVRIHATAKEKKSTPKRASNIVSSFPLAVNIYKANSDEFKTPRKGSKKVKKSVLTLPNVPTSIPQTCTVSDMNDSDYFNTRDGNKQPRMKKRLQAQKGKTRVQNKNYVFYDRDARFCSQMNIDSSSTDIIEFTGDGKRVSNKNCLSNKPENNNECSGHDVWAVLRNINRFQFRPSPPVSDDYSNQTPTKKKRKNKTRRNNFRDRRLIETCRTEEFAYISRFDFETKSPPNFSQSSSFDRITVIDKQDEISEICHELEQSIFKRNNEKSKLRRQPVTKNQNKNVTKNNVKVITPREGGNKLQYDSEKQFNKRKAHCNKTECISKEILNDGHNTADLNTNTTVNCTNIENEHFEVRDKETPNTVTEISKNIRSTAINYSQSVPRKEVDATTCDGKGKQHRVPITTQVTNDVYPQFESQEKQIRQYSSNQKYKNENKHDSLEYLEESKILPNSKCDAESKAAYVEESIILTKSDALISSKTNPGHRKNGIFENNSEKFNVLNNNESVTSKKEIQKHPPRIPTSEIIKSKQQPKPPKPVQQLRDTMIKFLYKKVSVKSLDDQFKKTNESKEDSSTSTTKLKSLNILNKADVSTQTLIKSDRVTRGLTTTMSNKVLQETNTFPMNTKNSRAKGKWASDFIENVIKKIRNGIYYNPENVYQYKKMPMHSKEVSIQTLLIGKNISTNKNIFVEDKEITTDNSDSTRCDVIAECSNNILPGFDTNPPALEIETLNTKEIAIRHCTTNVMVQFDIAHLFEPDNHNNFILKSSSFTPIVKNENQTKILKCKTTIMNAVLPAELCSIIPTVLKFIINSTKLQSLPSIKSYQNDSNLYTISELLMNESPGIPKCEFSMAIGLSSDLKELMKGTYRFKNTEKKVCGNHKLKLDYGYYDFKNQLLMLYSKHLLPTRVDVVNFISFKSGEVRPKPENSTCTALQLYRAPNYNICKYDAVPTIQKCTVNNLLKQICNQGLVIRFKISMPLSVTFENCNSVVRMQMASNVTRITSINFSNLKIDSLICGHNTQSTSSMKLIENQNNATDKRVQSREFQRHMNCTKTKKKKFVTLYKKCKSTSNISGERRSIPLTKITNLEEFFDALGSGRTMLSIFDGIIGKKILSSVSQMKDWITELSQRQAMLILLLTNKKDTPNLVRFRPLLLQGIAVNRITRASELDMEIEVIERENFNRFSRFEGIPYTLEADENPDNLLEELFWIAKTTASDYQKPFNESSEKLLKSLLEKRKKLNPSYLRVMARYVGLGLLKSPRK
ncbi:unnamed protein product [Diatraea saccharalis]|uniref:Uncharacterized protein n=1 Tax=Diatraea saccharalis TaxID=40085 RepID=A0A9N9R637_9NEOP|nr:unnamed protein product [Diatraea saccharalis]